ncbi:MAG TPA: VWA domain-containing protein [Thermoanaerobaculia bacterium]|nr:VWA domain-containing protein [Thermoanaerobaculia bacterium]
MKRPVPFVLVPALALAALLPAVLGAQEQFQEETSVVVVEVPVQVLDGGKPVRGLTAESFEVWDGKVRRPITSFEVVDLAAAPAGARPQRVPPAARRNFLLLFDLAFSNRRSLEKAETAARDLLKSGLHPQDLVGVAFYSPARGLAMPVGFTADRGQVERVLDALAVLLRGDVAAAERQRKLAAEAHGGDPLGLAAADFPALVHGLGSLAGVEIALSGETLAWVSNRTAPHALDLLANALNHMQIIMNPHVTEAKRGKVGAMTEDLGALARMLRDVEGRKALVFFSDGFDDDVMMGQRRERSASSLGQSGNLYGNARGLNDLNRMLEEFRRSGWVVHTVETIGVAEDRIGGEALFYVANETGGTYFNNTNDLGEAVGRMLAASAQTYLLSFPADDVPADGSFRKLRIELKGGPRGARVVHRAGWFAPTPHARRPAAERRFAAADLIVAGEERNEVPLAVLATPFEGAERGYVPVVVELEGSALAAEKTGEGLALELYGYAFDRAGKVQDFFAQQLRLDAARAAALNGGPLRFVADLELPPGEHELRLLVRGGTTGKATLRVLPLAVPSSERVAKRLLPPFFVAGEAGAVTVRETAAAEAGDAYPFRLGEQPFVPQADPELAAGEEVRLFLAGYHLASGDLRVAGRVLTADGRPVDGGALTGLGRIKGEGPLQRVLATFRPQGLAAGDYRLEVTLAEPQGAKVSASAPFRVVAEPPRSGR